MTTMRRATRPRPSWDEGRLYPVNGRQLPSVTTILSIIAKPVLAPWYAREERRAFETAMLEVATRYRVRTVFCDACGYAGTLDWLADVHGVPTLGDIKTSRAIYAEAFLQNVAYRHAASGLGLPSVQGLIVLLPKAIYAMARHADAHVRANALARAAALPPVPDPGYLLLIEAGRRLRRAARQCRLGVLAKTVAELADEAHQLLAQWRREATHADAW